MSGGGFAVAGALVAGAIPTELEFATTDPYAGTFDAPESDFIVLAEIQYRPPQEES